MAVGDRLALRLQENASTGYVWVLDAPAAVHLVRDRHEQPSGAGAGATGVRELELAVQRTGHHELRLRLQRPWEPPSSAVDHMALAIDVVEKPGS